MLFPGKDLPTLLQEDAGWRAGNVLDIRLREAFAAGHLQGAASIPLTRPTTSEVDSWLQKSLPSIFLPARHEPLLLAGDQEAWLARVASHLEARGRSLVTSVLLTPEWDRYLPREFLGTGLATKCLWRPPSFLARHAGLLPPPATGPVLDLGCGSGRAAVWLAVRGYRVTAIDWQPEALELGRQLAASRKVRCDFQIGDLRRPEVWPPGPWAVILNFRFLLRPMLADMAERLSPGGVAVVRTFRSAPGYRGHPQRRHRLERGELLKHFPAGLCEILVHEENHDPDGRPAAGIVARRR